ncbi:MAG: hypothetical protein ACJAS1_001484 [Oleiphilaceae bacterium]|jgi:hypothetical protein
MRPPLYAGGLTIQMLAVGNPKGETMPHFLVDCSESIFKLRSEEKIIE